MPKCTPLELILIANSTYTNTWRLKKRLINAGILKDECLDCGIGTEWNGKILSLQLDHINGINSDNRLENLRILCPNCHSQTDTYAGSNNRGTSKPREKTVFYECKECGTETLRKNKTGLCRNCYKKYEVKYQRPPYENLLEDMKDMSYQKMANKYGVSKSTVALWIRQYRNK